jgi:thymidylate synthase (FAD)
VGWNSVVRETEPEVFLICRPQLLHAEIHDYLKVVGGLEWYQAKLEYPHKSTVGQLLVEFAAKFCYRSWSPGLNPNTTKVTDDSEKYLAGILASGHGSVLEHANYTFIFHNVSRVFTHELVRHRAGVAISQESLRYVRLTDIPFRVPPVLEPLRDRVLHLIAEMEDFQTIAAGILKVDEVPFPVKKQITSAMRRLAPLGLSTGMVWTANVRALRHCITMRTDFAAEEEMRFVFNVVYDLMSRECPWLFADFEAIYEEGNSLPWQKPANNKV